MKIKPILQVNNTECGLCCVAMISQKYGFVKPMSYYRELVDVGRDGVSVKLLCDTLKKLHFESRIVKLEKSIIEEHLPVIVHISQNHFIVVEKYISYKNKVVVIDPAIGKYQMSFPELLNMGSGFAIWILPDDDFVLVKESEKPWSEIRFLLRMVKKTFSLSVILSFFTYFFTLIIPRIIQVIIDRMQAGNIIIEHKAEFILPMTSALLFLAISLGRNKVLVKLEMIIDKNLLMKFMEHVLELPYKYFEKRAGGEILFRISLLNNIRLLISEGMIRGIIDVGSLIFLFCYMFYIDIYLTVIMMGILGFVVIIASLINSYVVKLNKLELQKLSRVTSIETETIDMIFDIKSLGIEQLILERVEKEYKSFQENFKRRENASRMNVSILQFFQLFVPFFAFLIAVLQKGIQDISIGKIIAFYTLSNMAINTVISVVQESTNFQLMKNYILRVNDVLQEKGQNRTKKISTHSFNEISFEDVSFKYSDNSEYVLKDINITIPKGKKIAIVGESGAGKSTLIKLLLGLYCPNIGSVKYDQENMSEIERSQLNGIIGIIPQDVKLFNESIKYNIALGDDISDEALINALKQANFYTDVQTMPLKENTVITRGGINLSAGQRQRLALARILVRNPQIIILDEATSYLDGINENEIMKILSEIHNTQIIVSHRFSTICNVDYVYFIENHVILEEGTVQDLLIKRGRFFKLFEKQINS